MSRTAAPIRVNGIRLWADIRGGLFWPETRTLVVADLHLGKGSAFAVNGIHLPPYDARSTLQDLAEIVAENDPARVICLGDSFDDPGAAKRLHEEDAALLRGIVRSREWIWIAGNHDPLPSEPFGDASIPELRLGPLTFRHAAVCESEPGEISGHFHPKASCRIRGGRMTGRCFVVDGRRIILPAFGAYAGGLDVLDPAISSLFREGFHVWVLGRSRLHRLPRARLDTR